MLLFLFISLFAAIVHRLLIKEVACFSIQKIIQHSTKLGGSVSVCVYFLFENIRFKQSFWLPYQNHEYWLYFKITQVIKLDDGGQKHTNVHEQHRKNWESKSKERTKQTTFNVHLERVYLCERERERSRPCVYLLVWECSHNFKSLLAKN